MKHSSLAKSRQRRWGTHISMDPIPDAEFRPLSATNNKSKVCSGLSWRLSSQANILSQVIWLFSFPKPFQMVKKIHLFILQPHIPFCLFLSYFFWGFWLPCLALLSSMQFCVINLFSAFQDFTRFSCRISVLFFPPSPSLSVAVLPQPLPPCLVGMPSLYWWTEVFIAFYLWFQHPKGGNNVYRSN